MKKKRIVVILMSLFAVTPALLGTTAGAIEHRSATDEIYQNGDRDTRECSLRHNKKVGHKATQETPISATSRTNGALVR